MSQAPAQLPPKVRKQSHVGKFFKRSNVNIKSFNDRANVVNALRKYTKNLSAVNELENFLLNNANNTNILELTKCNKFDSDADPQCNSIRDNLNRMIFRLNDSEKKLCDLEFLKDNVDCDKYLDKKLSNSLIKVSNTTHHILNSDKSNYSKEQFEQDYNNFVEDVVSVGKILSDFKILGLNWKDVGEKQPTVGKLIESPDLLTH